MVLAQARPKKDFDIQGRARPVTFQQKEKRIQRETYIGNLSPASDRK